MTLEPSRLLTFGVLGFSSVLALSSPALAHCDGMDGPVVKAAQNALRTGDVNPVLIWVQPEDEAAIRQAFEQTRAVRTLGPQARELADRWFFETLVRIHRAGEGAPFTGLKPAGRDLGPAIPAADEAIKTGSLDGVLPLITEASQRGLRERFANVMRAREFDSSDLIAGREYVQAYVTFIHHVEGLYQAAGGNGDRHEAEAGVPHDSHRRRVHTARQAAEADENVKARIPKPLKIEHDDLHNELVQATQAGGRTGEAAKAVARALHKHFVKEEQYALPPLGLLKSLAHGGAAERVDEVIAMTGRLRAELPQMLAEHEAIKSAVNELKAAAVAEGRREVVRFAEELALHAQIEEEVLYPAAILIGEHLEWTHKQ